MILISSRYNHSHLLLIGLAADLERSQEVERDSPEVIADEGVKKKSGNLQLIHFGSV